MEKKISKETITAQNSTNQSKKARYDAIDLIGFDPKARYTTFEDIQQFISQRDEEDSELPISNNLTLYYQNYDDTDTLLFEVVYDDIRDFKACEELDITEMDDEDVMDWVLGQMGELDEAEREMWDWVQENQVGGRIMLSDGNYYDIEDFEK